jgi:hypothetical protein
MWYKAGDREALMSLAYLRSFAAINGVLLLLPDLAVKRQVTGRTLVTVQHGSWRNAGHLAIREVRWRSVYPSETHQEEFILFLSYPDFGEGRTWSVALGIFNAILDGYFSDIGLSIAQIALILNNDNIAVKVREPVREISLDLVRGLVYSPFSFKSAVSR